MAPTTPKLKFKMKHLKVTGAETTIPKKSTGFKPEDLDRPFYPSDDTVSLLATITYKEIDKEIDYIPPGWKVLLTGRNKKDGYFGAAFYHEDHQQLVISHRGTDDFKDMQADFQGIAMNQYISQVHTSCTFAFIATAKVCGTNACSITITGHSLGGWLAQITAFALEYLTLKGEGFESLDKTERKYHPHTVTFDSPGCYQMLCKLSADYFNLDKDKAGDLISGMDIATYFVVPNDINSKLKHVGRLFTFKNYLESIGIDSDLRKRSINALDYHKLGHFRMAFTNATEIVNVVKWPRITWGGMFTDKVVVMGNYSAYKVTKMMGRVGLSSSSETDGGSSEKDENLKKGKADLETEPYDQTVLSINVFKESERIFLEEWKKAREDHAYKTRINQFLMENNFGTYDRFLPDFEILNDKIKCKDPHRLRDVANRIKWLLVIFPDAFKITK